MTRLAIRVQPGAKANEIVGWVADAHGAESLKIRLRAPAVEGKANAALVEFLAESLRVRARQITLERGDKSRGKLVVIEGLTMAEIRLRILR
jgi:uncharacterized protein (TIGR00251 family)